MNDIEKQKLKNALSRHFQSQTYGMDNQQQEALETLISVAKGDTGQSSVIASFLLSWWNASFYGGFGMNQLWALDTTLKNHVLMMIDYIANNQDYPDCIRQQNGGELNYSDDLRLIAKKWHEKF